MKPQYLLIGLFFCSAQAAIAVDPPTSQPVNKEWPLSSLEFVLSDKPLQQWVPVVPEDVHFVLTVHGLGAPWLPVFANQFPEKTGKYISSVEARDALQRNRPDVMSAAPRTDQTHKNNRLNQEYYDVQVLASSPQQGETLVRAFLEGYLSWWRENGRQLVQKTLDDKRKGLETMKADLAAVNNLWPVPQQTINDLKTKQLMIEVDMSGVRAKIDAAQKQVRAKTTAQWQEQMELANTTAQIDLAGLLAEKDRIANILIAYRRLPNPPDWEQLTPDKILSSWQPVIKDWEEILATVTTDPATLVILEDKKVEVRPIERLPGGPGRPPLPPPGRHGLQGPAPTRLPPPPPGVEGGPRPPVPPSGIDGGPRQGPPPGPDGQRGSRGDAPGRPGQMPPPPGEPRNPPQGADRNPQNPPPPSAEGGHRPPPSPAGPRGQQPPPPAGNGRPDQPPPAGDSRADQLPPPPQNEPDR